MSGANDEERGAGETEWRTVEQRAYDRHGGADLTTTVVEAVAAAEGVDSTAVKEPKLYDVVDVAAVEHQLFGSRSGGKRSDVQTTVEFRYRRFRVTVTSDGWVEVAERVDRESNT
ncbi:MAG: HalOD1 output domain-containing protein [Halobacteriaceae archaeon]